MQVALLHAVNMRRIGLGLEPVVYDSYIQGVELPLEPVPFVLDDLLYPAYLKACGALGATPIDFGDAITVQQNPNNGMLSTRTDDTLRRNLERYPELARAWPDLAERIGYTPPPE